MILKDKLVAVRKEHRCSWCGEKIEVGHPAHYRAFIWEGYFATDYLHPECYEAMCNSDDMDYGFESFNQLRGKTLQESEQ